VEVGASFLMPWFAVFEMKIKHCLYISTGWYTQNYIKVWEKLTIT